MATLGLSEAERESIERFEADVIQPSMTALVIIDFWSDRSPLSKQLSPVLEKLAADYADKGVKLVKIDVDKDKLLATQFRIQSIPTVYAIYRGQPVADLTSYRSEGQLKKVLDQLLAQLKIEPEGATPQAEIEPLVAMGEAVLADGEHERAVSIFRQVREMAPDNAEVIGGLARALIAAGEKDEARQILNGLPEDLSKKSEIARARAALEVASAPAVDTAPLEKRIAAGLSGAISRTCEKMLAARAASPSASTCSPIATRGSISACGMVPAGWIFSCASNWSSTFLSCPSLR